MPEHLHKRKHLTSFQLIILGFAGVILIGALILTLPVSSASGVVTPFDQALFTSTSAVCVTGLVVQDTGSYWSVFGQAVILALIQIGGLGVVTVAVSVFMLSGRKISLMQRSTIGCYIGAKSRRYCPADKIYSERDLSDRSTWSSIIVSGILS